MQIVEQLNTALSDILFKLYQIEKSEIKLENTNPKFKGDYTFVVFPYLRNSKKSPEATAEEIGNHLINDLVEVQEFNVVKGFLNIELSNEFWMKQLESLVQSKNISIPPIGSGQKVVIEYSSPNTNKPLHLGHIRNNVLGSSMAKILETNGFEVVKTNLVNDRGVHICKSMLAWLKFGEGETPESSKTKGDHLVGKYYVEFDKAYKAEIEELKSQGLSEEEAEQQSTLMHEVRQMLIAWENGDAETISLWKKMNSWVYGGFEKTYKRLGIEFDTIYYESDTYLEGKNIVLQNLDSGIFYKKEDGSIWVDLTDEGLDHKILLRSDGTSVYITQDIGTAYLRYQEFKMDRSVYVVGNEQDYHFKVLQLIFKKLGYSFWEGIYHMSYGMVDLPSGKMKSREGTVVDADDLMDEMVSTAKKQTEALGKTEGMENSELDKLYSQLGIGALKYFLLRVDAKNRMLFDPNESIDFQGNTGPFIQYTHTRITSIEEAADSYEFELADQLEEEEKELIIQLFNYPQKVNEAAHSYNPSIIAAAAFDLAKSYNKFYHQHSILGAKDPKVRNFRLGLSKECGKTLKHAFGMLGIDMPQRM